MLKRLPAAFSVVRLPATYPLGDRAAFGSSGWAGGKGIRLSRQTPCGLAGRPFWTSL